jgi:hypothetical protein
MPLAAERWTHPLLGCIEPQPQHAVRGVGQLRATHRFHLAHAHLGQAPRHVDQGGLGTVCRQRRSGKTALIVGRGCLQLLHARPQRVGCVLDLGGAQRRVTQVLTNSHQLALVVCALLGRCGIGLCCGMSSLNLCHSFLQFRSERE